MAEFGPDMLGEVLDSCADGVCLVDPVGWCVVFANRTFREWIPRSSASTDTSIFDWLPDLAARRGDFEQLALGQVGEFEFSVGLAGTILVRRVKTLVAIYLRWGPTAVERRVDPLTGLADRAFFLERLGTLLHGERASDHRYAVLFIDVDGFKQVNDSFGHLVGDRVLGEVARRLAGCVRAVDHVARFGGDEFVVLLETVRGPDGIEPVAERIRAAFNRPIVLAEGEVKLAVSVGAAEAGPQHRSAEALIDAADRAMYAAKRAAT